MKYEVFHSIWIMGSATIASLRIQHGLFSEHHLAWVVTFGPRSPLHRCQVGGAVVARWRGGGYSWAWLLLGLLQMITAVTDGGREQWNFDLENYVFHQLNDTFLLIMSKAILIYYFYDSETLFNLNLRKSDATSTTVRLWIMIILSYLAHAWLAGCPI